MKFSRRSFIKFSGATAAGLIGFQHLTFAQGAKTLPAGVYGDPLFYYGAETFRELIGEEFTLLTEDAPLSAVLIAVKDNQPKAGKKTLRKATGNCFTVSFQTPTAPAQATYTVFHSKIGTFDLFLVPGSDAAGANLLHATFNRL